ncbi:MAG TPA: hypothetical protein VND21_04585 [Planctomycetota bacterium]|nr:hypothetical protein [Planctomycetota bacterium]
MPSTASAAVSRRLSVAVLSLLSLLLGPATLRATAEDAPPADPAPGGEDPPAPEGGGEDEGITKSLDARIGEAVKKGVQWLKGAQLADGSWGLIIGSKTYDPKGDPNAAYRHPAGSTALAIYALLKCGVAADDPVVKKGFSFLKSKHKVPGGAYEMSAMILAVTATADPFKRSKESAAAGEKVKLVGEYREWCQKLVDALLARRKKANTLGWRYNVADNAPPGGNEDTSSTQLAALALLAADRCGVKADSRVWNEIITFTLRQQEKTGPDHPRAVWPKKPPGAKAGDSRYAPPPGQGPTLDKARGFAYILSDQLNADEGKPTGAMTACGIGNLQMARYILAMREDKTYLGRDLRGLQQSIYDGLAWLDANWSSFANPKKHSENVYHIYYLYCCERAYDLLGNMRIGEHTWFPEMAEELLRRQAENGPWNSKSTHKPEEVLDTCFALLFLRRATQGGIPSPSITDPSDAAPTDSRGG